MAKDNLLEKGSGKKVRFVTKYENYIFIVSPASKKEVNGVVIPIPGKTIKFNNHEYITSDPVEIRALRDNQFFGMDFVESATVKTEDMAVKDPLNLVSNSETATAAADETEKANAEQKEVVEKNVTGFVCSYCGKVCKSKRGLQLHKEKAGCA